MHVALSAAEHASAQSPSSLVDVEEFLPPPGHFWELAEERRPGSAPTYAVREIDLRGRTTPRVVVSGASAQVASVLVAASRSDITGAGWSARAMRGALIKAKPVPGRRGPAPLVALVELLGLPVTELRAMARAEQWVTSTSRRVAADHAGPRVPVADRGRVGRNSPAAMWSWIDGLDAIETTWGGAASVDQVASRMGFTRAALSQRMVAIDRHAAAEAERDACVSGSATADVVRGPQ